MPPTQPPTTRAVTGIPDAIRRCRLQLANPPTAVHIITAGRSCSPAGVVAQEACANAYTITGRKRISASVCLVCLAFLEAGDGK